MDCPALAVYQTLCRVLGVNFLGITDHSQLFIYILSGRGAAGQLPDPELHATNVAVFCQFGFFRVIGDIFFFK